jgi:Zn-dependent peptidase ImmA (M78 family)
MTFPPPPVPPPLKDSQIRQIAEAFRFARWPQATVPVDAELIAEYLGIWIDPVANLRDETGIDATLSADRKIIYIDLEYFRNPRQENRVRFSVAHELGHCELHRELFNYYLENKPKDVYEWAKLMRWLHDEFESIYETQADEFASCLLVPADLLAVEAKPYLDHIRKSGLSFGPDAKRDYIAGKVQRTFMVSPQTLEIRLRKYGIVTTKE